MGPNGVASTVEQNFKQKPGCGMSSEKLWRRTFGRHQRRSVKLSEYSGGKSWVWPSWGGELLSRGGKGMLRNSKTQEKRSI